MTERNTAHVDRGMQRIITKSPDLKVNSIGITSKQEVAEAWSYL
jgi:hypothetical protein